MATTLGSVVATAAALALAASALPAKATTFVYVGCTDSNEIHVLQLEP
jgi:6-phosphogluconolactonase